MTKLDFLKIVIKEKRMMSTAAKTGTGPILLTCSFPYVRDWLNEHPFRNESNARLICNSYTGWPIKPEAMWTMMKYLRARIIRLIEERTFTDKEDGLKDILILHL
jgi:integrase/recombinase XerD